MPIDQFKTQVLLLHSEQSTLDTLSSGFGDRYTVHCATSGSEALNTMLDTPINVIISAHDLPGMSGLEALREARKRSPETIGILLAGSSNEALVGAEEVFEVVRGDVTGDKLSHLVDNATQQMHLMALADSANDTAANPDEPGAEHIVMETSDHGASIISDGTGTSRVLSSAGKPGQSKAARAVDVLVLTKDQAFLDTVNESARGMHVVHYANTLAQADDAIRKHKVGVAVIDAAMVGDKLEKLALHLRKGEPRLVAVVAGRRDDGEMLLDLINRGKVYRFLMKPVSPGRARLAIEASVRHHLDAPDSAFAAAVSTTGGKAPAPPAAAPKPAAPPPANNMQTGQTPSSPLEDGLSSAFDDDESGFTATVTGLVGNLVGKGRDSDDDEPAATPDSDGGSRRKSRLPAMIGATVAVVAIAGAAVMWTLQRGSDTPEQTTAEPATALQPEAEPAADEAVEVSDVVDEAISPDTLLGEARSALNEGQIYNPGGGNALELYAAALADAPDSEAVAAEFQSTIGMALAMAEEAMLEGRFNDAEAALGRVAEVDPENTRLPFLTTQLVQTQLRARLDTARTAIRDGRFEDAASAIAAARSLEVSDASEIDTVDTELADALSAQQLDEVLDTANARLAAGALLAPANDNARYYFQLILAADPDNVAAQQGLNVIASRLVLQARAEIDDGNLDDAAALIDEASAVDAGNADLATAVAALDAARDAVAARERAAQQERERQAALAKAEAERQAAAELAAEEAEQNATTEPASADAAGALADVATDADEVGSRVNDALPSAAAGTSALQPATFTLQSAAEPARQIPLPISSLTRTRYVAPKYPRSAQRRNQAGWVDVVFTVAADGSVKDIEIRSSQPGEVFVDAARTAVSKWEFEPVMVNGEAVDTLAGVRMMFALEE